MVMMVVGMAGFGFGLVVVTVFPVRRATIKEITAPNFKEIANAVAIRVSRCG